MANQEDKIRSELIAAIDELPVNYLEEALAQGRRGQPLTIDIHWLSVFSNQFCGNDTIE